MLNQLVGSLAALALLQGAVVATPGYGGGSDLGRYIKKQSDVSIQGVLANIGADGSRAQGAAPGAVVASPSRSDPDCKLQFLSTDDTFVVGRMSKTRICS